MSEFSNSVYLKRNFYGKNPREPNGMTNDVSTWFETQKCHTQYCFICKRHSTWFTRIIYFEASVYIPVFPKTFQYRVIAFGLDKVSSSRINL